MAQISYGTITITDTTDIERIYPVYCKGGENTAPSLQPLSNWSETVSQAGGSGDYIWQRIVTKKQNITVVASDYSDAVRLTGDDGSSLTIIKTQYAQTQNENGAPSYGDSIPSPINEGWWLWTKTIYSDGSEVVIKIKQGQKGETGQRGTSILKVTTAPTTYTTTQGGFTPSYRMSLSTVKSQSGKDEVLIGDIIEYNSNHYRVGYVNSSYVYLSAATSIKGTDGQTYYTWIKYAPNDNPTNAQISDNPTGMTYIGIYIGTTTPAPSTASSYAPWMKYIGTDGGQGPQGISVTGTRELYWLKTTTNPSQITWNTSTSQPSQTIYSTDRKNSWTSVVPTYEANAIYYTCIETSLSNATKSWSAPIENKGLTNANQKALDAYNTSTARDTEVNALKAQAKHFWWDSEGAHIAAGQNTTSVDNITQGQPDTYTFNALTAPGYLKLRYKNIDFAQLATNSLTFYRPAVNGSTYVQGKKAMDLTADALTFYKPLAYNSSNEPTAAAQLSSTGLNITDGTIQLGTGGSSGTSSGNITLSNVDFTRSINGTSRNNLRLAIGQYFGVKNDGTLYANNVEISGKITASSLTIGSGATVSGLSTSNISGMNDYALQSSLDTEVAQRKAIYAVSTTGATTAAKTTESGTPAGFVLYNGATVTVKFNKANSTTTPTLNVNGTGAKTIKSYTGAALTAAEYTWPAGAAITFTYDGSYWRMQDGGALQAKADAAASASAASGSATAASNSASAASTSASSASSSATSASNSASSASSSATTATNQASAAAGSATTASTSATAASNSATAASNSATAASNSATAASNSATAASNSATAAAEVMGGFTVLWNYSAFGTSTAGDAFICGFDSATGTKSDANGWVKWNGTKRTITKQQVNPGTIVPYNIPIYIVCRLSSATGTTGTNYMVWYNSGWKYAACPSPTAVGGSWTWTDNRDIILGSFVETGANEVLTECELFNPPWTSKQITTNTTTPTSYIMDTDSNKGITIKPKDSTGNDFLRMNSTAIEFFRNSTTASVMSLTDSIFRMGLEAGNHTTINSTGLHLWKGTESVSTNEVALFGSSIVLYQPGTNTAAVSITNSGATFTGGIVASSLMIGSGSSAYNGVNALNITGYTIEILQNSSHSSITNPTENIWIYPVLYHNNTPVTVSDKTAFTWFKDGATTNGIAGDISDGGILGVYGSTYRVTYTFEDGAVIDGASPVQQNITVSDTTHITEISNNGIKVHHSTNNNNYIQIDSTGLEVVQGGTSVAKYGTAARIGTTTGSRFLMNSDSLQAYNSLGTKYFEVTSSGLNWNNGTTTNYITYDASNGLQIASASPSNATRKIQILNNGINIKNDSNNYLSITSSKIALFKNNIEKLQLTDSLLRLGDSNNYVSIDSDSLDIYNNQTRLATFYSEGAEIGENSTTAKIGFNQGRGSITARDLTGSTTGQYDLTFGIDDTGWGSNYYALVTGLKARKVMSNTDESVSRLDVMANNNGASFNMLASHPQYNSSGDDIGSAWPSISGTTENTGLNGVLNLKVFSTVAGTIESEGIEVRTNINSARTSKTTYINFTGNYITFNGTTIHSSDKRLKTHINYLGKEAIDFISALHPAYFSLKEQKTTGFYAQEVEYIDPWNCFVNEDINGYKTLNYIGLIAPLVTYCQHLEKRISELEIQLEGV